MNKITEKNNLMSTNIDTLNILDILKLINKEDEILYKSIRNVLGEIEKVITSVIKTFNNGGKLYYIGCGSSGRLGVLDAVECPPTFSTDINMVQAIIAGGSKAMFRSIENAEDQEKEAAEIVRSKVTKEDIIIGISANGSAKFVLSGLREARKIKATTCLITSNHLSCPNYIKYLIPLIVGPEIISGSTRMKAGSATKMVLNMITTTSMIKLNKTYGNLMVDLSVSNNKLKNRATRIISQITLQDKSKSEKLLKNANSNVKIAIIMYKQSVDFNEAEKLLLKYSGNLRAIIG